MSGNLYWSKKVGAQLQGFLIRVMPLKVGINTK